MAHIVTAVRDPCDGGRLRNVSRLSGASTHTGDGRSGAGREKTHTRPGASCGDSLRSRCSWPNLTSAPHRHPPVHPLRIRGVMRQPRAILVTQGLSKEFQGFRAVGAVDLRVTEGTVHALVGPNGAGKTTLFNLLTGFLRPSGGRITFAGHDITGQPPERIAGLGVARSFQVTSLFPQMPAR